MCLKHWKRLAPWPLLLNMAREPRPRSNLHYQSNVCNQFLTQLLKSIHLSNIDFKLVQSTSVSCFRYCFPRYFGWTREWQYCRAKTIDHSIASFDSRSNHDAADHNKMSFLEFCKISDLKAVEGGTWSPSVKVNFMSFAILTCNEGSYIEGNGLTQCVGKSGSDESTFDITTYPKCIGKYVFGNFNLSLLAIKPICRHRRTVD